MSATTLGSISVDLRTHGQPEEAIAVFEYFKTPINLLTLATDITDGTNQANIRAAIVTAGAKPEMLALVDRVYADLNGD